VNQKTSPPSGRGLDDRARLAAALRAARQTAGLSGAVAGRAAGSGQSKISKIERGALLPSVDDVKALTQAYGVSDEESQQLVALAQGLREEQHSRVVLSRRVSELQSRIGELERTSQVIRSFQPTMVIGLFQTPGYATAVFAQPDSEQLDGEQVEEAVAERVARQSVLSDPGKQVRAVMSEGALRWQAGSARAMVDQLGRLIEMVDLPTVRLGIIPWTQPVSFFPRHGFHIYDTDAVSFGTETAFAIVTGQADVDTYLELFEALEGSASYGDQAKEHLRRIEADYRSLVDN
jgi:transcriptional regulator with XRE-family HTH domain